MSLSPISRLFLSFRRYWLIAIHLVMIAFSLASAVMLRFDFAPRQADLRLLYSAIWIALPVKALAFTFAGLDRGWWRLVGMADLSRVLLANLAASAAFGVSCRLLVGPEFPRSVYFVDFGICFLLTAGARFAVRLYSELVLGEFSTPANKNLLIYGAGKAGVTLLREIRANPALGQVVGFLDDDRQKRKMVLQGVPVIGKGRDAARLLDDLQRKGQQIHQVVIAMPSATGLEMREAIANCRAAGVACKTVPGLGELLAGKVLSSQIRDVSLEDLLGRETVQLDEDRIRSSIAGRAVMVTGAAGSIGSELCRQVARLRPGALVLFDQAESDLFRIDLELRRDVPDLDITPELGDIRDMARVEEVIENHSVDYVFHAAAYKHVPMMEAHILEAARNNVLGTWNLVQAARKCGVTDFLMISSDKAVNPTSIMGVTKRITELMVTTMPSQGGTKFVAVRFGNVLGSNGSVVPIFKEQIAAGGPVTVTHPEMRRYFMTVREAVQLVLQASTMGHSSQIFVLDMGEPVRIADLALNMIRLSGLIPDVDIEIRYTGLRPGEKLFEEIQTEGENVRPTYHNKIKIFQGPQPALAAIEQWIGELERLIELRDEQAVRSHLIKLVPEYISPNAGSATGMEHHASGRQKAMHAAS